MGERERERERGVAAVIERKENGKTTMARGMTIKWGIEGGEEGSQSNPRCLGWIC